MNTADAVSSKNDKPKLLVVDDEPEIREIVSEMFLEHFDPILAANGKECVEAARTYLPSLILLDLMMPQMDGITACEILRNDPQTRPIPIIMLTALNETDKRIKAYELGIDDFIGKPFLPQELMTRVMSKYSRFQELRKPTPQNLAIGNLSLNLATGEARISDRITFFTHFEFQILKLLAQNESAVVSRDEILQSIWKGEPVSDRAMDAHIFSIRRKMEDFNGSIRTVYGKGYILHGNSPVAN